MKKKNNIGVNNCSYDMSGGSYFNIYASNIFYSGTNYTGGDGANSTHFILIP